MEKIRLIGIQGDQKYESWLKNIEEVLTQLTPQFELEEVNKIDAILDFNISAIPALVINNNILLEQNNHIPDANEIKSSILNYLNQKKFKMDSIIIPTDFSPIAKNAYLYGKDLAKSIGSQIKVVHACYPNRGSINGINIPSVDELTEYKQKQLEAFVQSDQADTKAKNTIETGIEQSIRIGFPKEEILKISESKEADMILMGTTGDSGILSKLFGSISSEVSLKSHCPVWLVPPYAKFNGIKNILYASNYESVDGRMLQEVATLANRFESNIHMVHVSKKKNYEENQIQELILEKLIQKAAPKLNFKMGTVISEKVWEGLDFYAEQYKIDLMVIVTRHRSFWKNIRHSSITKKMVFHTKTPLLIMHLDDLPT